MTTTADAHERTDTSLSRAVSALRVKFPLMQVEACDDGVVLTRKPWDGMGMSVRIALTQVGEAEMEGRVEAFGKGLYRELPPTTVLETRLLCHYKYGWQADDEITPAANRILAGDPFFAMAVKEFWWDTLKALVDASKEQANDA